MAMLGAEASVADLGQSVREARMTKPTTGTLFWLQHILHHPDLDPTETLIMVALADHVDGEDRTFVGIRTVATVARCSYATAKRRLEALEDRGYLTRTRRRREDGNLSTYTTTLRREWTGLGLNLSSDQGSPGSALTRAHLDEPAEVPSGEVPSGEETIGSLTLAIETEVVASLSDRRRDLLFEAVCRVCGIDWEAGLTKASRGPTNRAVGELREVGAEPADVVARAVEFRARYPEISLTPMALAKHWPALGQPQPRGRSSRNVSVAEQVMADRIASGRNT